MALHQPISYASMAELAYKKHDTLRDMITISVPAKRPTIQREPNPSSSRLFGRLSLEILHLIFHLLDFQSLSRAFHRLAFRIKSLSSFYQHTRI